MPAAKDAREKKDLTNSRQSPFLERYGKFIWSQMEIEISSLKIQETIDSIQSRHLAYNQERYGAT